MKMGDKFKRTKPPNLEEKEDKKKKKAKIMDADVDMKATTKGTTLLSDKMKTCQES